MSEGLTRFLRIKDVIHATGLSQSTIYARITEGKFPKPVPLGEAANSPVGWIEEEIAAWQKARVSKRAEMTAA